MWVRIGASNDEVCHARVTLRPETSTDLSTSGDVYAIRVLLFFSIHFRSAEGLSLQQFESFFGQLFLHVLPCRCGMAAVMCNQKVYWGVGHSVLRSLSVMCGFECNAGSGS